MKKPLAIDFHSRSDKSGSDFRTKIDHRFPDQNRSAIFIFKSDPEFIFSTAIMIPFKNYSGKIGDRFSLSGYFDTHLRELPCSSRIQNRSAVSGSKSDPVYQSPCQSRPYPRPLPTRLPGGLCQTEPEIAPDCPFFRTVRQHFSKKRHPIFRNRPFRPPFSIPASFPRPEMTLFGNDTRGDHGLRRAGAHPYSRRQQNANTDGFSWGDFCRIRGTEGIARIRQRSALQMLLITAINSPT
jgi:hypothetical protein